MKYYTMVRMNELYLHTLTQMNLTNIILIEISRSQKNMYSIIPFIKFKIGKTNNTKED